MIVEIMYLKFNNSLDAENFTSIFPAPIAGKTGRHNYTEWDQILLKEGSFHQSLSPFKLTENKKCRMNYSKDMCKSSLEILNKTILIPTDPNNTKKDTDKTVKNIKRAALAYINNEHVKIKQKSIDIGKFDYSLK